ncbi:MAG: phenylacetate-CoA oxygenase subunit PaaJ [Burkholderiales bacterium]|nr:phenylacetate-CoA oxygenase subunit PaaJ [Burkholderiales bacterium]
MVNTAQAWALLDTVPDPELPALSLRDLGIVRDVRVDGPAIEVVLTPTYSGCPATEVIAQSVLDAFSAAGCGPVTVTQQLAPPWTSDWISAAGRAKLQASGIVPPGCTDAGAGFGPIGTSPISIRPRHLACPRCSSRDTERLSVFGSTACKALYRCRACREPFEHFKPL